MAMSNGKFAVLVVIAFVASGSMITSYLDPTTPEERAQNRAQAAAKYAAAQAAEKPAKDAERKRQDAEWNKRLALDFDPQGGAAAYGQAVHNAYVAKRIEEKIRNGNYNDRTRY
jgi:hypothetical protein